MPSQEMRSYFGGFDYFFVDLQHTSNKRFDHLRTHWFIGEVQGIRLNVLQDGEGILAIVWSEPVQHFVEHNT